MRQQQSNIKIITIADQQSKFAHLLESSTDIDNLVLIKAGKFRRYPNQSTIQTLLDIKTLGLNIRDGFRTLVGIFQSFKLLRKIKPNKIFIKGGYVGVPVGISAKLLNIPYITHDSDATPGLANRIIGRWASLHLVGYDKSLYNYPTSKTIQVGVPIADDFKLVTAKDKLNYKQSLKISKSSKVVFITGGSQGAKKLNQIIAKIIDQLLAIENIYIIHQTGRGRADSMPKASNYNRFEYSQELYKFSGVADVIVTRAGSSVAEFASQHKPLIVIPADHLADNHQLKNAKLLEKSEASVVLQESELSKNPTDLLNSIKNLINNPTNQNKLSYNLAKMFPNDATNKIAKLLLDYDN